MDINDLLNALSLKQKPKDNQFQLKENQLVKFIITTRWDGDHTHCDCETTTTYTFDPNTPSFIETKETIYHIVLAVQAFYDSNGLNKHIDTEDKEDHWWEVFIENILIPNHCTGISNINMYLQQNDIQIEVEPE